MRSYVDASEENVSSVEVTGAVTPTLGVWKTNLSAVPLSLLVFVLGHGWEFKLVDSLNRNRIKFDIYALYSMRSVLSQAVFPVSPKALPYSTACEG